jgi:hypothetical protein
MIIKTIFYLPGKIFDQLSADATIEAGKNGCAFVNFSPAQGAGKFWPALAVIFIDLVQATIYANRIARVV